MLDSVIFLNRVHACVCVFLIITSITVKAYIMCRLTFYWRQICEKFKVFPKSL